METVKITASEVNALRKQTGTGMMDCKNALVEANGDLQKAVEILRKKGQKVAAKRSDRDASEGMALATVAPDKKRAVVIALNCETDFVAKNDDFTSTTKSILNLAVEKNPASLDELLALDLNGMTVAEVIVETTGRTGEKVELSAYTVVTGETVVAYNHPGNMIASVVALTKAGHEDSARDVAMQVAAMAPIALNRDGVDAETVAKETEIGKAQAIKEGKPEEMAEKIAVGRLNKFFKENTLLEQAFIKDNKMSIEKYLQSQDPDLTVVSYKRVALAN